MDIKKDHLYKEYVLNRNLKPGTIQSYTRKLQIYNQVTGLTLTQLIEQVEPDLLESHIPAKEYIQLAIANSNLRYATIIMLMCTSGITLVDIMN